MITTERLLLKNINESHVDDILKIRSNPEINKFVKRVSPKSNYDALEFILSIKRRTQSKEIIFFGISYKGQNNLIGTICLWKFSDDRKTAEMGYELLPEYHRKGIMSEAVDSVLHFGFNELNLHEILAFTNKLNEASQKLLLKHHFILEEGRTDEGFPDNIVFSLHKKQ
ncbi:GNAT family N-acetyltransferase [Chryseobacterium sp. OV279]|uniref:GNAT family N-acetyltransferase n=1 Tax=Chryseobacterium sp. OV279 TaxID=1500285 RepID=UPI00091171BC|nr:GNAT family N-acetyltransferase [Chryseobacterium sp. OV279]SHE87218.1 ribosomal-protein-alanine N-acetyltransferase [Chryseobacterium sp. OV279]